MKPKRIESPWLKPSAAPRAQMRLDLAVQRGVNFVGRQHHDHVGRCDGVLDQRRLQSLRLGCDRASRPAAKADDDVDPAIEKVERLRPALVAEAEDRDALAAQRCGVDVCVAKPGHGPAA